MTTNDPDVKTFTAGIVLVMLVGAALHDATTDEQREKLKTVLEPLKDDDLPPHEAMRRTVAIVFNTMGRSWRPTGQWSDTIEEMLPPELKAAWPTYVPCRRKPCKLPVCPEHPKDGGAA